MINACVVGLGQRGYSLLRGVLLKNEDINIVAVCDLYDDRIEQAQKAVADAGQSAKGFVDYKEALDTEGLDAVFIFSDWSTHTEMAIYAMKKGIAVASEVGCEYSLENCFELVKVQEETGVPYEIDRLAFVQENFFKRNDGMLQGLECHEITFYFLMKSRGTKNLNSHSKTLNNTIDERMEWLEIDKLDQYEAYPMFFRESLKNLKPYVEHVVTHQ